MKNVYIGRSPMQNCTGNLCFSTMPAFYRSAMGYLFDNFKNIVFRPLKFGMWVYRSIN